MAFSSINVTADLDPPLAGYRFTVFFLGKIGVAHPLDFKFQRVLGFHLQLSNPGQAKQERVDLSDPRRLLLRTGNLILERGVPQFSTLRMEVQETLLAKKVIPRQVLLSLMNEEALPVLSWLFSGAVPVGYEIVGLDANNDGALIERIELQYESVRPFSL